jgi:hypothetical protein
MALATALRIVCSCPSIARILDIASQWQVAWPRGAHEGFQLEPASGFLNVCSFSYEEQGQEAMLSDMCSGKFPFRSCMMFL